MERKRNCYSQFGLTLLLLSFSIAESFAGMTGLSRTNKDTFTVAHPTAQRSTSQPNIITTVTIPAQPLTCANHTLNDQYWDHWNAARAATQCPTTCAGKGSGWLWNTSSQCSYAGATWSENCYDIPMAGIGCDLTCACYKAAVPASTSSTSTSQSDIVSTVSCPYREVKNTSATWITTANVTTVCNAVCGAISVYVSPQSTTPVTMVTAPITTQETGFGDAPTGGTQTCHCYALCS